MRAHVLRHGRLADDAASVIRPGERDRPGTSGPASLTTSPLALDTGKPTVPGPPAKSSITCVIICADERAHPSRGGAAKPRDFPSQPGCRTERTHVLLG